MSWIERYQTVRDRWLSSKRFQLWAANFPLTRPVAQRRARALFDVCAGFVYSQILYACVRLKVFDLLALEPQSADGIARTLHLSRESTDRLLQAAVSLKLIERRIAGRYGLGPLGAAMVGNPGITAMVEHHNLLYSDLKDPVALLRHENPPTELSQYWAYSQASAPAALPGSRTAAYTELMAESLGLVADEILGHYPLKRHRCLMDVGGGDGSFLVAVAKRCPGLALQLFDLPPVAVRAALRFEELGLKHAAAIGGDFFQHQLPIGADVISLVRVLHDHDDEAAGALLGAIYRALPPEGVVLIAEPMLDAAGAEAVGGAYFGFYLLAMGRGRTRSPAQLQVLLTHAGFADARLLKTHRPLQAQVMVARKPVDVQIH
jgi:demethylspheroidene O-methyltransferase